MRGRVGWIAEWLYFPLAARCVPIYWGAENLEQYIPRGCYIDRRDFGNNDELYRFMQEFDQADYARFCAVVSQFRESGAYLVAAMENILDTILNWICPDYPREMIFSGASLANLRKTNECMNFGGVFPYSEKEVWDIQ